MPGTELMLNKSEVLVLVQARGTSGHIKRFFMVVKPWGLASVRTSHSWVAGIGETLVKYPAAGGGFEPTKEPGVRQNPP